MDAGIAGELWTFGELHGEDAVLDGMDALQAPVIVGDEGCELDFLGALGFE